jgi:hypothetical protein
METTRQLLESLLFDEVEHAHHLLEFDINHELSLCRKY